MVKKRPVDDRHENAVTHVRDDLAEQDRGPHFDLQFKKVGGVRIVGVLDDRLVRPWRRGVPTLADDSDTSQSMPDRLDGAQHAVYGTPAEPIMPHIEHAVL